MKHSIRSCSALARTVKLGSATILLSAVLAAAPSASAALVTWTGNSGQSWATASNWSPAGSGPGATDTASFTDAGSITLPGEVTSILNANRTVGGLAFANGAGRHHTLDLATRTLTIAGSLHINTDVNANSVTTIRNGAVAMNSAFGTLNIGRASAGSAVGFADLTGLTSFNATLQDAHIGSSTAGNGVGTLSLPFTSSITAQRIWVGTSNAASGALGTVHLGANASLLSGELKIGKDNGTGIVDITPGGNVNIGSAVQRTALSVGVGITETNSHYGGTLDLTGSTLTAFLGDVTVGQRTGIGFGRESGTFIAGNAGTVNIGAPGSLANVIVGRRLTGDNSASAVGLVDFSGLSSLDAHLNTLAIGTAFNHDGSAQGTLKLAASNVINANTVIVGSQGHGLNTLALGAGVNTIRANELIVGRDFSSGIISAPAGSTVNLGTPLKRTSIILGVGVTDTNSTFTGTLDFANATLNAYLDAVTIGSKDLRPGAQVGLFNISSRPENRIEATSIFLGGPRATGTLNFGGGQLFAGSITRGEGTANFNWTGGRLSVNTFGAPATLFNLDNSGTGTLAPGSASAAVGVTTIHGNYTQGAFAALDIDIAGASPANGNDLLTVSGAASLAGTLSLNILNDFAPSVGQSFLVATYASRTGTFSFVAPPALPADVAFQLDYASSPTQLFVRMIEPTDGTWTGTASTGTFGAAASWNPGVAPTTTSNLSIGNSTATSRTITVNTSTTVHRVALAGETGPLTLLVPAGINLGVASELVVGPGATLGGGGRVLGDIVIAGGGVLSSSSPATFTVDGGLTVAPGGRLNVPAGSVIAFVGPVTNNGTITGGGAKRFNSGASSLGSLATTGSTIIEAAATASATHIREAALTLSGQLSILPNGTPTGTSELGSLTIHDGGKLDLADNDMVVHSTAANREALHDQLFIHLSTGIDAAQPALWNGASGITSSTAAALGGGLVTSIGMVINDYATANLGTGRIMMDVGGVAVGINDVVMKYTWTGDADLNGFIDGGDYFLIDNGFAQGLVDGGWLNGDFDYNGIIDGGDYFLIDNAYSQQTGTLVAGSAAAAAVPEPAIAGLLLPLAFLARRRSRRPILAAAGEVTGLT